ncbi:MAG: TonB-dependent receptor [Acidobacteria bacterium]|nr:TonB-dependent receptor [Acidobacteriota bacterium]
MKTILKVLTAVVFAFGLLLVPTSIFAQTSTTGTIEGTVTDSTGAIVPGVTVLVSGANLIRPQSATTNDEGSYRVSSLPPGRYSVVVEAIQGFAKYEANDVEVNLSKSSGFNITLSATGSVTQVDVVAGANIDQTSNTSGRNVSTEQFSNFPTQRTVQSIYTIAPSVTRSGLRDASGRDRDPSVGGSSGPENNYILDGVNTSDPAFGGAGSNLPFEFVQEVEIKTGAFGAEYGKSTGGIFNVITKSGGNEFRGDAFVYGTAKSFVRDVKASAIPQIGAVSSSFSEIDAGFDIGGPIIKDKLWFFGAFNPQIRKNFFLTQTFLQPTESKITTPFYAGKITYGINDNNTFTFSTFGDFSKQEGFLFRLNNRTPDNGFGSNLDSFNGTIETGGHNYTARLNSNINQNFVGEFMFGLHLQRANTIPVASVADKSFIQDNFAVLRNGAILPVTDTNVFLTPGNPNSLKLAFVDGRGGGSLQRAFTRDGFGLVSNQNRDRFEFAARFQSIFKEHTFKYGFEYNENRYKIATRSSGPARTFADPFGEESPANVGGPVPFPSTSMPGGVRVTNRFGVCAVAAGSATTVQCPTSALTSRLTALITAGQGPSGITTVTTNAGLTAAQLSVNPILVLSSVRVRDFSLNTGDGTTKTRVESFYIQDDIKLSRDVQLNLGVRWDYQQALGISSTYLKLNSFKDNLQPRIGFIWDFTGKGRGKISANYARFLETPLPLDVNVRAGGDDIQLDRNINTNRLNAPVGSVILAGTASGLGCLGCSLTPVDPDLKPQTVNEFALGFEYEAVKDLTIGVRGVYRAQGSVIEDGSFDDGTTYFLFNPGESTTERLACNDPTIGCFGRARRYYRALEFSATKRFTNNFQIITSYVFSSLTGNYEGLFRNDNGQSDPNITSLFDLPSLLGNTYGRLPNDRPHQFKFNGTYQTPFKLVVSGNLYAQSGIPFSALIPHPIYGDNEGFQDPRGTSVNPVTGKTRTPTTYNVDLGFYYPITFSEKRELRFQLDWFNITNTQRAIQQDQTLRINSGIAGAQGIPFANPTFGTGTIFQFPSALRLGAKFSF